MIVVSDTSVITALIQIERAELLSEIFGNVIIPTAVAAELAVSHVTLPAWIRVMDVRNKGKTRELRMELDAGESEAIALALELEADFLLIDEKLGRAAVQRAGLAVIGVLGVASAAKHAGLLPSVATVIRELREVASFRISTALEARVLRDAGES